MGENKNVLGPWKSWVWSTISIPVEGVLRGMKSEGRAGRFRTMGGKQREHSEEGGRNERASDTTYKERQEPQD